MRAVITTGKGGGTFGGDMASIRSGQGLASRAGHLRRQGDDIRDLARFAERFMRGAVDGYGPWHEHVLGALRHADSGSPFHLVRYEDLRADTTAELDRVLEFVGGPRDATAVAAA